MSIRALSWACAPRAMILALTVLCATVALAACGAPDTSAKANAVVDTTSIGAGGAAPTNVPTAQDDDANAAMAAANSPMADQDAGGASNEASSADDRGSANEIAPDGSGADGAGAAP